MPLFSLTSVILTPMVSTLASSPPLLSVGLSVLRETQTVASTGSGRRRRSKPNNSDIRRD
uniref:Secreted protein n=1 Tax=Brassica oleracea TaxID=3712 RepID=A0A3P6H1B1_BRAOL|nr:unnamed protein product [Brassica oleracea]